MQLDKKYIEIIDLKLQKQKISSEGPGAIEELIPENANLKEKNYRIKW